MSVEASAPESFDRKPAPRPPSRGWFWLPVLLTMILLTPFYIERFTGAVEKLQYANTRGRQRALSEDARTRLASLEQTSDVFRLVARSVEPSVVHIDTVRTAIAEFATDGTDAAAGRAGEDNAEQQDAPQHHEARRPSQQLTSGQGSGLIVDDDGFILTNYHVVQAASSLHIRLSDGRTIPQVRIVGIDRLTDLALLKIEAEGLSSCSWGNSGAVEVGDWVLAMGNPFGLDRSMTAGIVSAKRRRQIIREMNFPEFIQTDASVNPGSSGGPLLNLKGEVVGINTAIVGQGYQGISFAIPSDIARDVFERLRDNGRVVRGWLGVALRESADVVAGEATTKGAIVDNVIGGSPAEQAGLRVGDVVLRWNGAEVADSVDLRLKVARTPVGEQVNVVMLRNEEEITLPITVAERPERYSR